MKPYDGGGWRARHAGQRRRAAAQDVRRERQVRHAPAGGGRSVRQLRALHRPRPADAPRASTTPTRRCTIATRRTTELRLRRRGAAPPRHDADDQRVLRLGLQLVRVAPQGRHLAPDRLREPVPRLAGHVAAPPLPVAREGEHPVVDLLRGDQAQVHARPSTGSRSTRSPRAGHAVPREAASATRRSPTSASRPRGSRSSARSTCRTSTRSRGSSSARSRRRTRSARRSPRSIPSTRSSSSPSCSGAASRRGAQDTKAA